MEASDFVQTPITGGPTDLGVTWEADFRCWKADGHGTCWDVTVEYKNAKINANMKMLMHVMVMRVVDDGMEIVVASPAGKGLHNAAAWRARDLSRKFGDKSMRDRMPVEVIEHLVNMDRLMASTGFEAGK